MNTLASIIPAGSQRLAAALAPQPVDARTLFHPVEHALRDAPADLAQPASGAWIGIDPELADYGVSNAVARLCLGAIQQRLPQWGCTRADGSVVFGREFYARSAREVEAKPVFLMMIGGTQCGADSGPGISWPMSCHATWIPGVARWVVTASADGTDLWGCADIAIGSFRGTDICAGAGRVIRRDWRRDWTGVGQAPWAICSTAGLWMRPRRSRGARRCGGGAGMCEVR